MRRLGEIALISEYLAPLATHPASLGLKDDAALLRGFSQNGLVITSDALVAGIHFFEDDHPGDAAYKALAVNVSDLAAKGAGPVAYTMTLALAEAPTDAWAANFSQGLARAQAKFGIALIGGDTVSARGSWWISITAFGEASPRGLVPRGGANPGDLLYVSGTVGDSALGLQLRLGKEPAGSTVRTSDRDFLLSRYLYPEPRIALAQALANHASAAMDVSDGLALDLSRMCAVSQVSAEVGISRLPLSEAAKAILDQTPGVIQLILTGGDDYEILAAVPPEKAGAFEAAGALAATQVSHIGAICAGLEPPKFVNLDGTPVALTEKGYEHFSSKTIARH